MQNNIKEQIKALLPKKKTEKNILLITKNIIGKIKTYGRTSIDHGQ